MTMPHLMNCAHSETGWCLDCVVDLHMMVGVAVAQEREACAQTVEAMTPLEPSTHECAAEIRARPT